MQHTKRLAFAVEMRSPTSGDEDDDQYGSEAQVETQEKMGSELSHKYQGPEWDGKKESYTEWRWEATPYLDSLGLESVRRGRNRSVLTTSARANFLLDMHERGEIETRHMPGEDTVADTLTKPLEKKKFIRLREYLLNMRGRASELCATGATVRKKVADGYRRIADAGAPRGSA